MPFYLMLVSASETAWLNLTNVVLGIAVLMCCALIAGAAVREFTVRSRGRAHMFPGRGDKRRARQ